MIMVYIMNTATWSKLPVEIVSKILVYRPVHPCAALIKDSVRDEGSYTFKRSLDFYQASDFRRQMIRYGYTDWDFDRNESSSIIGIYGPDVNEKTGEIADCIIQMINDEEDAMWASQM